MNELSYVEMLQAVTNGKATAAQIADICNQYNITPEQLYTDLYESENISFWKTNNGSVRSISAVSGQRVQAGAASGVDTAINSNAGGSAPVTFKEPIKTPVNTKIIEEAGRQKVTFDTEIAHIGGSAISDGKFSVNTVGLALAAVGAGIAAGKAVDGALYTANPDFFDSITWGDFNPEHWSSITADIDENDPLYVRFGAAAINAIMGFGVDDPTHPENMQMYLDEDTIAYMLAGLVELGAFDSGDSQVITPPSNVPNPTYSTLPYSCQVASEGTVYTFGDLTNPEANKLAFRNAQGTVKTAFFTFNSGSTTQCRLYFVSDKPFEYTTNAGSATPSWSQASTMSRYGYTVYRGGLDTWVNGAAISSLPANASSVNMNVWGYEETDKVPIILFYGDLQSGGGVEGITTPDGATAFNPSNIDMSDTDAVIAALRSQFPDLFNDDTGIEQTVIDENGQEKTITYYPVPVPHIDPTNTLEPTGGEDYGTQNDPIVDPDTYPEELIKSITEILLQSPTPSPNLPDTGNGTTPTVEPPAGSATALWSIYNPTQAQIDSFGAWLWSNDFVEQLKKIFNDPMESIISLHKVFGTPATGEVQNIAVGYLDSGVSSKVVTAQYTNIDCGEVQLLEYFGNVYDYKDTSIELYLPFIGIVPLSVNDVMRSTIHIVYHIDVLTGACLADVEITRDAGAGGVLYQYSGDCAVHYPVSAGSYMGIVTGILSIAGGIAGTIATGGSAAPALIGAGAAATRLHTDVSRSGGFSGNAGAMGSKVPYLIISRPQTALPDNYLDIEGIGSNKTIELNTCNGYTRIKQIYLQGIGDATEGELNELVTLLKDGVIFPITETPPNE